MLGRLVLLYLATTNVHFTDRLSFPLTGLTPSQIYENWASPISYYIRMEEGNASFLRYRGPPILPSSEVVYIVHPYRTTQLFQKGLAPQELDQRDYDRICRAFSGDDVSNRSHANYVPMR